jgi:hypothetical protein
VRLARSRSREVFVPLAQPPGQAQVDFGECVVAIGGAEVKPGCFRPHWLKPSLTATSHPRPLQRRAGRDASPSEPSGSGGTGQNEQSRHLARHPGRHAFGAEDRRWPLRYRPGRAVQQPEQRPTEQDTTASPGTLGRPEPSATAETAASNDIAVAFAALGAELKGLLGLPAEVRANDELRQNSAERQAADLAERNAQLAAERAKAEKAITEYAALAERLAALSEARRPWWRRLVG